VTIVLPYPDRALWPNGRAHYMAKNRAFQKAKADAGWAAKAARIRIGNSPIPIHLIVKPKAKGPAPDADNCVSACKAYLDGIAAAIGVNDRHFAAPTVEIATERTGQFIISIGETQ
jgi:crossover junction endodeoxyribonuclease RusA